MSTREVIGLVALVGGGYYLYNKYYAPAATQPYTPVITTTTIPKITPIQMQASNITVATPSILRTLGLAGIKYIR